MHTQAHKIHKQTSIDTHANDQKVKNKTNLKFKKLRLHLTQSCIVMFLFNQIHTFRLSRKICINDPLILESFIYQIYKKYYQVDHLKNRKNFKQDRAIKYEKDCKASFGDLKGFGLSHWIKLSCHISHTKVHYILVTSQVPHILIRYNIYFIYKKN